MNTIALQQRKPPIPSGVLGTLIFVMTEIMLFLGFISAFTIVKAGAIEWPPLDQPRLPWQATAFNTVVLLLSGVFIRLGHRQIRDGAQNTKWLFWGLAAGTFFVLFQGYEWVELLGYGLTLQSSNYGGFFYLIIGAHAAHALVALLVMARIALKSRAMGIDRGAYYAMETFWYFVVGIWPILYILVYF